MSKKLCKSWTRTSYETIEISHVWTINGFSLQKEEEMFSSKFSSTQDINKRKWVMLLYPIGESEESKGHLSLYLASLSKEAKIDVKFSFSMNDDKGNCLEDSEMLSSNFNDTTFIWGFPKFCKSDDIFLNDLPNDILKITCNLSYINVFQNVSGTQESLQEPVPCSLSENLGALMTGSLFSDVTLSIEHDRKKPTDFKAHKNILAARSPYFAAMFTHDFKEKGENRVEIKDVKPEVFKEILTYIYTGKMEPQNMSDNDAKELLVAADRFALDGLKMAVKNLLVSKLNIENASELLVLGHVHSVENLKTKATDFVASNVNQVMETEGWKLMIRQHPQLMEPILGAVTGSKKRKRNKKTERLVDTYSDSD